MATDHNHSTVFGRLTRDPELTYTLDQVPICYCGLASNEERKDRVTGQWKQDPDFMEFTIYGRSGEAFAKYHSKGDRVFIEGRLKKQFLGKTMQPVIRVKAWQFVGGNHPQKPRPEASLERQVVDESGGPF